MFKRLVWMNYTLGIYQPHSTDDKPVAWSSSHGRWRAGYSESVIDRSTSAATKSKGGSAAAWLCWKWASRAIFVDNVHPVMISVFYAGIQCKLFGKMNDYVGDGKVLAKRKEQCLLL